MASADEMTAVLTPEDIAAIPRIEASQSGEYYHPWIQNIVVTPEMQKIADALAGSGADDIIAECEGLASEHPSAFEAA